MLDVLFTIDTELQFRSGSARDHDVDANLDANVFGRTVDGEHGLAFQLGVFRRHSLKAVFFVEAMARRVVGPGPLRRTVETILEHDQEIQLHLHPEWLRRTEGGLFGEAPGMYMRDYSLDQQVELVRIGVENLVEAGAAAPIAFRAGSFGANDDTLRAASHNGIPFDSSYNAAWRGRPCDMSFEGMLPHPRRLEGVVEVPITVFEDLPGHIRPVQLTACSLGEMAAMLEHAYARRWPVFVILAHSFELVTQKRHRANRLLVRRFERLCRYLAERRDRFRMVGFEDLDPESLVSAPIDGRPIRSTFLRTIGRISEQAIARWDEWSPGARRVVS